MLQDDPTFIGSGVEENMSNKLRFVQTQTYIQGIQGMF